MDKKEKFYELIGETNSMAYVGVGENGLILDGHFTLEDMEIMVKAYKEVYG